MLTLRVLPDAERVEQALLDAAATSPFVDATGFVSIAWLVDACEPAKWLKRAPVAPLGARLLVAAQVRSLGPGVFGDYAKEPVFARAAWDLFQQLKLQDATPDELERAIAALGAPQRPRLEYLLRLWRAYEAELLRQGLADRGDLLRAAADRLGLELPPRLQRFTHVEVHHLHDLPPVRARLLQALAATCHALKRPVKVTLPAANNPQVDVLVNEAFAAMEKAWQGLDVDAWPEVPEGPLAWVGGALFGESPPPQTAPGLDAFSAATPRDEARQIADRVREKLDQGAAPEEIAIVFRELASDAEALVEALEEVGVPARIRLGMPLAATFVGRLALALPTLVDDGFPVDGVLAVLESRYAPAVSINAPDAAQWFALAGLRDDLLGAEGRRGAYEVRLEALAARLSFETEKKEVRRLAERIARLLDSAKARLPSSATALGFLAGWQQLLEDLGLAAGLRGSEPRALEGTCLGRAVEQALARDQAAGDALTTFFEVLGAALVASGSGDFTISRREFARLLGDAVRDVNLQARGPRSGAVRVLDVRAIAGLRFRHIFIGGLVDGRFPGRPQPLALVAEDERAQLNAVRPRLFRLGVGDGELSLPLRQAEDRLLFHLALCAGGLTATLSRSRVDAGGRELIASPFLDELKRVVPEFVEHAVARTAVSPLQTGRAPADFYARVALEALSSAKTRLSASSALGAPLGKHFGAEPWFARAAFVARMEEERLAFFSDLTRLPLAFSGDLSAEALAGARATKFGFGATAPVSVSALGRYANCAFAGFLEQALRLEAVEEQGEEPDARTRGAFWHLVFEQLMPRMREKKWLAAPVQSLPPDELNQLIDGAIDDAAKKAERKNAVGHPALWKLGRDKARRMVRRVLFSESEGQPFKDRGWLPDSVELTFGPKATDPRFSQVVVPAARPGEADVYLNGKIDRVDLGPTGAGIVDYKAGKKKGNDASRRLLVSDFQLPAYVLALRQTLGVTQSDAAWLFLGDHEPLMLSELLVKKQTLDELMRLDLEGREQVEREEKKNLANAVHAVVGKLRAGDVGARPQDCGLCNLGRVCRISQRRIGDEAG